MIEGNTYYFILGSNCYKGIYLRLDRFVENNYILSTDSGEWSLPKNRIFNSKEECIKYMKTEYGEYGYFSDINFINC